MRSSAYHAKTEVTEELRKQAIRKAIIRGLGRVERLRVHLGPRFSSLANLPVYRILFDVLHAFSVYMACHLTQHREEGF